tara:strand:+ start:444 stop:695 length:252 start_codon:yes stop_codon:yes gene_type:complete
MSWVQWEEANEHIHENLLEDYDIGYERWMMITTLCKRHWGWVYDGSVDLKSCETWRALVDCLATHKEKEWLVEWETQFDYPLD